MKIEVKDGDIRGGRRHWSGVGGAAFDCPVALAAQRTFKRRAMVTDKEIYTFDGRYDTEVFKLPPEAQLWVASYDARERVSPFEFEVE